MELTKEEKAWVRKVNALLAKCPSDRLGFYTVGDCNVSIFDRSKEGDINALTDLLGEFGSNAEYLEARAVETLEFPHNVHSTAG